MGNNSVILHVGPHKTGSTALQKGLMEQRKILEEHGITYPGSGLTHFGHHELVNHLRNWPTDFSPDAFREEAARNAVTLLSSENFVHLEPDALARLKPLLPDVPVRVIFYLRRLVDLWPSHWQELVKHGQPMAFPEYLSYASFVRPSGRGLAIDQLRQIRTLARIFGEESLEIVGYDQLRQEKEDLLAHFLTRIIGLDAQDAFHADEINPSRDPVSLELIRMMNGIHREETGQRATAQLRIAVLERLQGEEPSFYGSFREMVEQRSYPVEIDSGGPVVKFLQNRIVSRYQHRFVGDQAAVTESYTAPIQRRVPCFEFPCSGNEDLRRALTDFYRTLPESARRNG